MKDMVAVDRNSIRVLIPIMSMTRPLIIASYPATTTTMAEPELSIHQQIKQAGNRVVYLPLESNPEIFTSLIQELGVVGFECQDIISLDPELLDFVPRPVQALILTFPARGDAWHNALDEREKYRKNYEGKGEEEEVVWFVQSIDNACGLYAILHAVCNGIDRSSISEINSYKRPCDDI